MAIIMHPLTAQNGSPEYTADDYRHAINPLLLPSDGTAFNGLSGIRYGSPSPLVTVSGLTVTVKAHCGTISPWDGLGAYTYAITTNTTVQLADSTNDYKIAVTVEDPSQSHGTTPRGQLKVFTAGTPDSNINGLVIAKVNAGVVSDVAPMIRNSAILMARDLAHLNTIDAVDGQEAVTMADNAHYVRNGGAWVSRTIQWTKTTISKDSVSISGRLDFDSMTAFLYIDWTNDGPFDSPAWKSVNVAQIKGIRSTISEISVPCSENTSDALAGTGIFCYTASNGSISWTHTGGTFNIPAKQWHRGNMLFPFEFI